MDDPNDPFKGMNIVNSGKINRPNSVINSKKFKKVPVDRYLMKHAFLQPEYRIKGKCAVHEESSWVDPWEKICDDCRLKYHIHKKKGFSDLKFRKQVENHLKKRKDEEGE